MVLDMTDSRTDEPDVLRWRIAEGHKAETLAALGTLSARGQDTRIEVASWRERRDAPDAHAEAGWQVLLEATHEAVRFESVEVSSDRGTAIRRRARRHGSEGGWQTVNAGDEPPGEVFLLADEFAVWVGINDVVRLARVKRQETHRESVDEKTGRTTVTTTVGRLPSLEHHLHLRHLSLSGDCMLYETSAFAHLTELRTLDLSDNPHLDSLHGLRGLTALEELNLRWSDEINSFQFLSSLRQLRSLNLDYTGVPSLAPLESLRSLAWLSLEGNDHLTSLAPLEGLGSLQRLNLSKCSAIEDLTPLAHLSSLEELDLSECIAVRDLAPLAKLESLRVLDLADCTHVRNLEALEARASLLIRRISKRPAPVAPPPPARPVPRRPPARANVSFRVGDVVRVARGMPKPPAGTLIMEGSGLVVAYRYHPRTSAQSPLSKGSAASPDRDRLRQETLFHHEQFVVLAASAVLPGGPKTRDLCIVYCRERDWELYVARRELEVVERAPQGD